MSAALALKTALAVGIRLRVDGDDLELEAEAAPPAAVLDLLLRHKVDILRLLRPASDDWSPEDWQVFFDERASIAEFDGGLPRAEAEARAFVCCITEWLNRNPAPSAPGRCVACGDGERPNDPLLPFGTETRGHAWLHRACWPAWCRTREAEAIAALTSMGIRTSCRDLAAKRRKRSGRSMDKQTVPTALPRSMDTPVSDAPTASEMTSEQKETVQLCWEGGPLQGDDYLLEYYPDDFPKLPTCLDRRPKPYLMAKAA